MRVGGRRRAENDTKMVTQRSCALCQVDVSSTLDLSGWCQRGLAGPKDLSPASLPALPFAYLLEHATLDRLKRLFLRTLATGFDGALVFESASALFACASFTHFSRRSHGA